MATDVPCPLHTFDRRAFALSSLGFLLSLAACSKPQQSKAAEADPTGSAHVPGTNMLRTYMPITGNTFWSEWRTHFIAPEGRVVDTGNGDISHSEGQSYGLLFALWNDDLATFTRVAEWTQAHLARSDIALHGWRWDPAQRAMTDTNNATDGDIVIAWALDLAGTRWKCPQWRTRAAEVRRAIHQHCVLRRFDRDLLLPGITGFVDEQEVMLNPSYFVWPALDHFAKIDGAATWRSVIRDSEDIAHLARFGAHQLPTDWISISARRSVRPAANKPPRFGYDAIRIALWGAQGKRTQLTAPIADYWRKYLAQGHTIPAWIDVQTGQGANYALSAGGLAIAARLLGIAPPAQLSNDYFAASQQLLASR